MTIPTDDPPRKSWKLRFDGTVNISVLFAVVGATVLAGAWALSINRWAANVDAKLDQVTSLIGMGTENRQAILVLRDQVTINTQVVNDLNRRTDRLEQRDLTR